MKVLDLPVMPMSTNLNRALQNLQTSSRAALISEHQGTYHLFSAQQIAVARHRGLSALSDLTPETGLQPVPIVLERIGDYRGRTTSAFALRNVGAKKAFVAVRNISIATRFAAAPPAYFCDGPRHHSFSASEVSVGQPCPRNDGYTIVAAL